jgi:hypothetical protein
MSISVVPRGTSTKFSVILLYLCLLGGLYQILSFQWNEAQKSFALSRKSSVIPPSRKLSIPSESPPVNVFTQKVVQSWACHIWSQSVKSGAHTWVSTQSSWSRINPKSTGCVILVLMPPHSYPPNRSAHLILKKSEAHPTSPHIIHFNSRANMAIQCPCSRYLCLIYHS